MPHNSRISGTIDPRFLTPVLVGRMSRTTSLVNWIARMQMEARIPFERAAGATLFLARYRADDLLKADREAKRLLASLEPFDDREEHPAARAVDHAYKRLHVERQCEVLSSWGRADLAELLRNGPEAVEALARFDYSDVFLEASR